MIYEISEKNGETFRIELQEVADSLYELKIGDRSVRVDAVKSGRTIYSIIEDGRQYEVMVDERGAHGFDVVIKGRLFHLEAVDERSRLLAQQSKAAVSGPQTVVADMAGKIVKVAAAVGDEVQEGQGIVIVEAMKMENEIPSPVDGRITQLAVSEGDTVEGGATLFVVEPTLSE